MNHYLAIDWGRRKIGIATADHETRMAFAYKTIQNDGQFFENLQALVAEKNITDIVVGMPQHKDHGNIGAEVGKFLEKLQSRCSINVHSIDEMFTTKMAQTGRLAAGKHAADDDADAARIILQDWLDAKK